ncbi:MAG TPA: hypothetical protein VNZ66_08665 [Aeromicrobium sp.]|nr:hypothetical protein [Aeromicrobium sp.]
MPAALRLDPSDEYPHRLEEATNFNESMYANVLDGPGRLGVWVRVGNRPNEGHAEVTCCVYLPDGRASWRARYVTLPIRSVVTSSTAWLPRRWRGYASTIPDTRRWRSPRRGGRGRGRGDALACQAHHRTAAQNRCARALRNRPRR